MKQEKSEMDDFEASAKNAFFFKCFRYRKKLLAVYSVALLDVPVGDVGRLDGCAPLPWFIIAHLQDCNSKFVGRFSKKYIEHLHDKGCPGKRCVRPLKPDPPPLPTLYAFLVHDTLLC